MRLGARLVPAKIRTDRCVAVGRPPTLAGRRSAVRSGSGSLVFKNAPVDQHTWARGDSGLRLGSSADETSPPRGYAIAERGRHCSPMYTTCSARRDRGDDQKGHERWGTMRSEPLGGDSQSNKRVVACPAREPERRRDLQARQLTSHRCARAVEPDQQSRRARASTTRDA